MPRIVPALTIAALALALVGCATGAPPSQPSDPTSPSAPAPAASDERTCAVPGEGSDGVDVTGSFGEAPHVIVNAPLVVETTERRVVIEGDGAPTVYGDTVVVDFTLYDGTTGEPATSTGYADGQRAQFLLNEVAFIPGLVKTIECSTVGSRVVGVAPASEAFGANGSPELGIGAGDAVVFVVDIVSVAEQLVPAAWTDGVPEVTRDDAGMPTVTLPDTDAPAELREAVLTAGDGATVVAGDSVTVDYQGTSWTTGEIFDQSYGRAPATFGTTQVVPGFGAALVGQKVGATVLVVMPPELAYGTDPDAHELGGQTLVFLIDILGVNGS